jgi:hypothetical protein
MTADSPGCLVCSGPKGYILGPTKSQRMRARRSALDRTSPLAGLTKAERHEERKGVKEMLHPIVVEGHLRCQLRDRLDEAQAERLRRQARETEKTHKVVEHSDVRSSRTNRLTIDVSTGGR